MGRNFALNIVYSVFFPYRITRFYNGLYGYYKTFFLKLVSQGLKITSNSGSVTVGEPNLSPC